MPRLLELRRRSVPREVDRNVQIDQILDRAASADQGTAWRIQRLREAVAGAEYSSTESATCQVLAVLAMLERTGSPTVGIKTSELWDLWYKQAK